ncbi:ferritin-like domain-containing protein [Arthrobacter sp. NPDC056691]|uniref:ferritin-like domain-containing protein n=1 Tax=Arthrobacter sp. NPDC056691 TaxID=3345913 RepID=UPI00366BC597
MNDDRSRKRKPASYLRYALLALAAFLVLSLGFVLIPRESPAPAAPPFSEQARAAALAETMDLRAASQQLADGSSGARRQLFSHTVTLLTTQARALLVPGGATASSAVGAGSAAGSTGTAGASGTTGPAATASSGAATSGTATLPALVAELSTSGKARLVHAGKADGGMARLLAAVGTAQLLQATALAQAAGTPPPALQAPAATQRNAATACSVASPSGSQDGAQPVPGGQSTQTSEPSGRATLAAALNRVVRTEVETVYGYQVALTRLDGPAADQAASLLATHEALAGQAEAYTRVHCVSVPPREPGYTLGTSFLQKPAAGLASLEAGTLPVYGDLVALSDGETRQWAVSSLVAAAQRTTRWGSDPGPVPGIVLDTALLPELPEPAAPSPRQTGGGAAATPAAP